MFDKTARWTHLQRLLDRYQVSADWDAEIELGPLGAPLPGWALVTFNGGRAPEEKWIQLCNSPEDACDFAARDIDWHPEAVVKLDAGVEYELRLAVAWDPTSGRPLRETKSPARR